MRIHFLSLFGLLLLGCSSAAPRPVFSDFLEVRELQEDDPLALRFSSRDGEEYRLGDPILSGKSISRLQIKPGADDLYDLYITLTGAMDSRWRRFARSRGRQAAVVVDGKVCCTFNVQDPGPARENEVLIITIPGVAESAEEAEEMDRFFEESKKPKKDQEDAEE
jgi:hypothetical protein